MSLQECIVRAADAGIINDAKQADLLNDYQSNYQKYLDEGLSTDDAAKKAGIDTFDELKFKSAQKTRRAVLDYKIKKQFEFDAQRYLEENPKKKGLFAFLQEKVFFTEVAEGRTKTSSVEERINITQGRLDEIFINVLQNFRHNLLGTNRNKATMRLMGKEIFEPGSTGNKAAEELAKAWIAAAEEARKLFNAAGGSIPRFERWHLPQKHNELLIKDTGYDAWRKFLDDNDILDVDNMIDYTTGKKFTKAKLEMALTDVYNTIATQGHSKNKKIINGSSFANRRTDHRFLQFKNYDAWETYNNKFGKGNVFDAMVGHIKTMARDIGTMQILGTNPKRMLEWMGEFDVAQINKNQKLSGKETDKLLQKNKRAQRILDDAYNFYTGTLNDPENVAVAKFFGGMRDLTSAMYLGAASFMAIGDFNLARTTAKFHRLPAMKIMGRNLKMFAQGFRQGDSEMVKVAASSGLIAEHWSTIASGMARVSADDTQRPEITRRIADFVLRTTGLSWLTQAGRWGAGLETMAYLGRQVGLTFDELKVKNPNAHEWLRKNQITSSVWDVIRTTELFSMENGAKFLRPTDILKRTDLPEEVLEDAFNKMSTSIQEFVNFSVPVAMSKPTVLIQGSNKAGTIRGEMLKNLMQFKQFPLTFSFTHLRRGFGRKTAMGKLAYLIPLIVSTTGMGYLAHELKQLTKGKDPTNLNDMDNNQRAGFIFNQMLHGGGLGFAGDFLFGGRYGGAKGGVGAIVGAVPMLGMELIDFLFVNPYRSMKGDDVNYTGKLADLLKKNFPGGSMWYARLALERYIFDQIQELIDPKYMQKRNRVNTRIRKEGTGNYFWKPGNLKPDRGPEFR